MRRLHWPRFAVFLMVIATIMFMTAATNGYAKNATVPQTTDELNSATVQSWTYAQNDGTIAQTAIIDVENADNAYNHNNGATAIIDATSTLVLKTTDYAFLMGNHSNTTATTSLSERIEGTSDASGIYFAAVTCDGTARYDATRGDAKKMAAKMQAEKKIVKTANTSGVVIRT